MFCTLPEYFFLLDTFLNSYLYFQFLTFSKQVCYFNLTHLRGVIISCHCEPSNSIKATLNCNTWKAILIVYQSHTKRWKRQNHMMYGIMQSWVKVCQLFLKNFLTKCTEVAATQWIPACKCGQDVQLSIITEKKLTYKSLLTCRGCWSQTTFTVTTRWHYNNCLNHEIIARKCFLKIVFSEPPGE